MLLLIMGLGITCLMTYCIMITIPMSGSNKMNVMFFLICFLLLGIYLIIKGLRKIASDVEASSKGEKCFGMIKSVHRMGDNLYNYEVAVYIEKINKVEVTYFDSLFDYKVGTFVVTNYYDREARLVEEISVHSIPIEIQKKFFTNETLKTTDRVTNYEIEPMDMPVNGTVYEWEKKSDETIK